MDKLLAFQTRLKAPKSNYNEFGGFAYRSVEDIFALIKPLEEELKVTLTVDTDLVHLGDRYYVKAIAEMRDCETGKIIAKTNAFAREQLARTKMDEAQLTGSATSYARKMAVGGMLLLDDNKDADALPPDKPTQKNDQDDGERVDLIKKNNLLLAKKFTGDLKDKMITTINDPKFNSLNGQQTLAGRIKEQLLKQTENLPPPAPRAKGARDAKFSIPNEDKNPIDHDCYQARPSDDVL